jgi:ribonuclease Z
MFNNTISFLIKCTQKDIVWLFNCPEGCQHNLIQKKIKLQQINNIVITHLEIKNTAGIIGLLSSLSLNTRIKTLNIYAPAGLIKYLQLLKKYSQTAFKYNLKIHIIQYGFLRISSFCSIYIYPSNNNIKQLECILIEKEKTGRFKPLKAHLYKIHIGPLYGKLKAKYRLVGADGIVIKGEYFTYPYHLGIKIIYLTQKHGYRPSVEYTWTKSNIIK